METQFESDVEFSQRVRGLTGFAPWEIPVVPSDGFFPDCWGAGTIVARRVRRDGSREIIFGRSASGEPDDDRWIYVRVIS